MRAPRQRRPRRVPWLASDLTRSFTSLAVVFAGLMVANPVLDAAGVADVGITRLAATLFGSWVLFAVVYAAQTVVVFARADAERFADLIAATTPEPGWRTVLWVANGGGAVSWALSGSLAAIVSVVLLVSQRALSESPVFVVLGVAVVITSWALIMLAYAVRYAREWVRSGGLVFGGDDAPRFPDFVYVAVQVATTFASSDVQTTTRSMRKVVAVNSVVAFAFNTVIVALLVSTLISAAS